MKVMKLDVEGSNNDVEQIIQSYVDDLIALDKHKKWFPKFKRELYAKYWDKSDRRYQCEKLVGCKCCGVWTTNNIPVCFCDYLDGSISWRNEDDTRLEWFKTECSVNMYPASMFR